MAESSRGDASASSSSFMYMSSDNVKGLILALSSSLFIGASFIVKKKGLKKAGSSNLRAGLGGYSYLYEPLWWAGMTTSMYLDLLLFSSRRRLLCSAWYEKVYLYSMRGLNVTVIVGEVANFVAYAFAPAILVTPLGALSIIVSAVLAHIMLKERLHIFGILGCILCVVGSTSIVLHAPPEREILSVKEVWTLATEPAFLMYSITVVALALILVFQFVPLYGNTHVMVYIGICSLMGSLSVMSVKALGIALKLTFEGTNQLVYPETWVFAVVVTSCILMQMNYLNKALDTFNTAVVSPIYYVMFTSLTIVASIIMFKDWDRQNPSQIITELCGFITILSGTFLLHTTKDMGDNMTSGMNGYTGLPSPHSAHFIMTKRPENDEFLEEGIPLRRLESVRAP